MAAELSELVILCEGNQDVQFFGHLIASRNLPAYSVTCPEERTGGMGKDAYKQRLQSFRFDENFERVKGILVTGDNDNDPTGAFESIRKAIRGAGFKAPNRPNSPVREASGPAIAVMMLPSNDATGAPETLCLYAMLDAHPELADCMNSFSRCAGIENWNNEVKTLKMKMRVMLSAACQEDPNVGIAQAWSKSRNLIPLNHGAFDPIANYLGEFHANRRDPN